MHVSYARHMTSKKVCKIGNNYYLYERESYWDPVKKKSCQRNSTYIGKCDKNGKLISSVKKRIDHVHSSFPVGPLSIFYAAAQELQLTSNIRELMEVTDEVASHILCLTLNQIVGRRPVGKLDSWVLRSPLVDWEDMNPENITQKAFEIALSNLCIIYPDGAIEDNGLVLQYGMTKVWNDISPEPPRYYYDITKQKYYGTKSFYGEPGYYPGGTNKNVVGFGLVTSSNHNYPVMCRPIRGSKHDSITVQDTVNTLNAWGFERLTLIMDRGMVSKKNIELVMDSGFDQIGILPETNKEIWKYISKWSSKNLTSSEHIITRPSGDGVYARAWTAPLFGKKKMKIVLVEDPKRKLQEQIARDQLIRELEGVPSKKRLHEIKRELGKQVKTVRGRRGFSVDTEIVERNKAGDGRFIMFSTDPDLSVEEIFNAYFQRDIVEKAFCTIKGELKLGPIRFRRRDRIDAYSTIVYLSYLLWSWTERKLKEKFPDMTLSQALDLVDDVTLVKFKSGRKVNDWITNLNRDQKKVLKHLGALDILPVA